MEPFKQDYNFPNAEGEDQFIKLEISDLENSEINLEIPSNLKLNKSGLNRIQRILTRIENEIDRQKALELSKDFDGVGKVYKYGGDYYYILEKPVNKEIKCLFISHVEEDEISSYISSIYLHFFYNSFQLVIGDELDEVKQRVDSELIKALELTTALTQLKDKL